MWAYFSALRTLPPGDPNEGKDLFRLRNCNIIQVIIACVYFVWIHTSRQAAYIILAQSNIKCSGITTPSGYFCHVRNFRRPIKNSAGRLTTYFFLVYSILFLFPSLIYPTESEKQQELIWPTFLREFAYCPKKSAMHKLCRSLKKTLRIHVMLPDYLTLTLVNLFRG